MTFLPSEVKMPDEPVEDPEKEKKKEKVQDETGPLAVVRKQLLEETEKVIEERAQRVDPIV